MRHYYTLIAHESDEGVNEKLRKLITDHADLCTLGLRSNWYYEWRHDHVDARFRAKADWRHFAETSEQKHVTFLREHDLLESECDAMPIGRFVLLQPTFA